MFNRNSTFATPADYCNCIDHNLKLLSDRRYEIESILSRSNDWCLLDFLAEYGRRGCVQENVLCSLMSIVGSLSHQSFVTNIFTGSKVWLNLTFHTIGSTGTNKSFLPEEMIFAHHELNKTYPGFYSCNNIDENESEDSSIRKLTNGKRIQWAMLVSTITEAALSQYLAHSDVTLINQDGDQALKQLNYYDQGSTGTAVFCLAIDGCQPGQSRTTGVERIVNKLKEPSKLSIYVASTGSKFGQTLQKLNEEKVNDGVFGRVIYLHQPMVEELPLPTFVRQASIANHTHFAHAIHIFFREFGPFEFRFRMKRTDTTDLIPPMMSPELLNARIMQGVIHPEFVRIGFIQSDDSNDEDENLVSSYQCCYEYCQYLWMESSRCDTQYICGFLRKSPMHLMKLTCNLKVVRIIYRLLSQRPIAYIRCDQGDRMNKSEKIPPEFFEEMRLEIENYLEKNSHGRPNIGSKDHKILVIDKNDVDAAYNLLRYQLETVRQLFSIDQLRDIIAKRVSKCVRSPTNDNVVLNKRNSEIRFEVALQKLMLCSSIVITKQFLTNNRIPNGGFLKAKSNTTNPIKADDVITELINLRLLVKCDMVHGALYGSYYRQFPFIIQQDPVILRNLQRIGVELEKYCQSFKNSLFPKELRLNENGLKVVAEDTRWIAYYHTFRFEESVQKLINSRLMKREIIFVDGQYELAVMESTNTQSTVPDPHIDMANSLLDSEHQVSNVQLSSDFDMADINLQQHNESLVTNDTNEERSVSPMYSTNSFTDEGRKNCMENDTEISPDPESAALVFSELNQSITTTRILRETSPSMGNIVLNSVSRNLSPEYATATTFEDQIMSNSACSHESDDNTSIERSDKSNQERVTINDLNDNPSHEVWARFILHRNVVLTRTYLSRNMKRLSHEVRNYCVERLVHMGILRSRTDMFTKSINGFLKAPPTDADLQKGLIYFKISVCDYEASFNDGVLFEHGDGHECSQRALLLCPGEVKAKFTKTFVKFIQEHEWYGKYLSISPVDIETPNNTPSFTISSSTEPDVFRNSSSLTPRFKRAFKADKTCSGMSRTKKKN